MDMELLLFYGHRAFVKYFMDMDLLFLYGCGPIVVMDPHGSFIIIYYSVTVILIRLNNCLVCKGKQR